MEVKGNSLVSDYAVQVIFWHWIYGSLFFPLETSVCVFLHYKEANNQKTQNKQEKNT